MFAESVDKDSQGFALSNLESILGSVLDRNHEILDFLVVDLAHHGSYLVSLFGVIVGLDSSKNLIASKRNYSFVLAVPNH